MMETQREDAKSTSKYSGFKNNNFLDPESSKNGGFKSSVLMSPTNLV